MTVYTASQIADWAFTTQLTDAVLFKNTCVGMICSHTQAALETERRIIADSIDNYLRTNRPNKDVVRELYLLVQELRLSAKPSERASN